MFLYGTTETTGCLDAPTSAGDGPLKAVAGDGEHCCALELEIVPDAIRDFMNNRRRGNRGAVAR